MTESRLRSLAVFVCVALAASAANAEVVIAKLLPFAGADSVRIELTLTSEARVSGIELSGRIVPLPDGAPLWEGGIATLDLEAGAPLDANRSIRGLKPRLWSPPSPAIYNLVVTARKDGRMLDSKTVRFGFRSFKASGGRFFLNGKPIFLRGNSINPPGRGTSKEVSESRELAAAYLRYMKGRNVNLVRLGGDSQVWLDLCDELGMMVFQGRYGAPRGGSRSKPPNDFGRCIASYKEIFEQYVRHPSVVIYVLSNEMPYKGEVGEVYMSFLRRVHETMKEWDPNRLHIGNAGFGLGRAGDIRDVHPYWGWYSGDFLSFLRLRYDEHPRPGAAQPWTFSECVGCYTGPDGGFNVRGKLIAAQEKCSGHANDQSEAALKYQAFLVKQAVELVRRLRPINPSLAGIMPFTTMFFNWQGVNRFEAMKPKPAMAQLGVSMQPVLLSWELWQPQVYGGRKVRAIAHIVNDSDDFSGLADARLIYRVEAKDGGKAIEGEVKLPDVPYYESRKVEVLLNLPKTIQTGEYKLLGEVVRGAVTISANSVELFIADERWSKPNWQTERPIALYDLSGKTAKALERLGVGFKLVDEPSQTKPLTPLVIAEGVWDERLSLCVEKLKDFIRAGGRALCLRQDGEKFETRWLPAKMNLATTGGRPYRNGMNINLERPWHPIFDGLSRDRFAIWSDYSGWDESKAGYPRAYPVTLGFRVGGQESLAQTAILANYGRGLQDIALCEIFDGDGSVILSGFDLVNRSGLDPVADRLLVNLIVYAASREGHHAHPLIESPIVWGDYAAERGVVTGVHNGLLVNASRFRSANHYVPRGRRPFGPFRYNGLCHIVDLNPDSKIGSGMFWARIPAGKRVVVTKVENPTKEEAEIEIYLNGERAADRTKIAPGETVSVRSGIPLGVEEASIRYVGDKRLIILETAFQ